MAEKLDVITEPCNRGKVIKVFIQATKLSAHPFGFYKPVLW